GLVTFSYRKAGVPVDGAPVDAGEYSASARFASANPNYANAETTSDAALTIAPAPVVATAGGGAAPYDAAPKAPSACEIGGAYTGDLTCANSPATVGPAAGTTVIVPVVSGTGLTNFAITTRNGSYTISAAPSKTTVACPGDPVAYNGEPQDVCSAVVIGPGGSNQALPVVYADNTHAGLATASAAYGGDAN